MKIETLTKEQEAAIIPFREKWIKRTLRTEKTDEEIKQGVKNLYKTSGEKEPIVFIMDSPFGAQVMVNFLRNLTKEQLEEMRLVDIKMDNIWNNIRSNIRDNIRDNIWNNIESNIWDKFDIALEAMDKIHKQDLGKRKQGIEARKKALDELNNKNKPTGEDGKTETAQGT